MAVVQALNHLNTLVLGLSIRETGISREELERFSTPLFRARLEAVENLFSHPQLYAEIIAENPHISRILDLHEKAFSTVKPLVDQQGAEGAGGEDAAGKQEGLRRPVFFLTGLCAALILPVN